MNSVNLKSVSELITKGTTPTTVGGKFTNEGVNFIKSESVGQYRHLDRSLFQFIDEKIDEKLKRSRLKENDLLFSIAGAYLGKLSIVRKDDLPANTNQAVGIVRLNKNKVDVNYLYYYFSQDNINKYINKLSSQSSQPNLNLSLLGNLKFDAKPISTQKQIAKVLSDLDAKIEINNKINQQLEAMAKLLYDYWFVQFDFPNTEGKPYKSSGGKMVYNEVLKREIPEGWEGCKLGDVIEGTRTGLNPRQNFVLGEGDNYYVTIKNIKQGRVILDEKCDKISDEALKIINRRSDLKVGDILYTSIEPVGTTYLLRDEPENWNINESVFTVRPDYERVTSEFLYMFLSSDYIKSYTKNVSAGSIHKGVRHNTLRECKFNLPLKRTVDQFTQKINPILDKLELNQKQNQKLSELRDWLLPMLMNGQVQVGE